MKTAKGSKYQAIICGVELYEIIPETGYTFATSNTKDNEDTPSSGNNGGKFFWGRIVLMSTAISV